MRQAAIISAVRLPVGRVGSVFSNIRAEKMGAMAMREAINRASIQDSEIDEVIFCSCENDDMKNVGRIVALEAGLPIEIPAYQVQRGCASSLTAMWDGVMMIRSGYANTVVCGGCESTSLSPYLLNKPKRAYSPAPMTWAEPIFSPKNPYGNLPNGLTAEEIANKYQISRERCDEFAVLSHKRAAEAYAKGYFEEQILPVPIPQKNGEVKQISRDEPMRENCTIENLSGLKPSFLKDGVCTAGNSSPLSDGASCIVMMEYELAKEKNLDILAVVTDYAAAGCDPRMMGEGPIYATQKLMKKTGMTIDDFDLIEINEAFAAQTIRCMDELQIPPEKLNVNGGAIALGHPFAATGTILVTKMVYEMKRRNAKHGLVSFCVGGGLGVSALLSRPE